MKKKHDLDLSHFGVHRESARIAFEKGDVVEFLCYADNMAGLDIVRDNMHALQDRGIYEAALLEAFIGCRLNNLAWSLKELRTLFGVANKEKLRAAGDPLPGPGPFTLYRGVAGRGRDRRVKGFSWTSSLNQAKWFAERGLQYGLLDPAVIEVRADESWVLAYTNYRKESEFIVDLPPEAKPRRVARKHIQAQTEAQTT